MLNALFKPLDTMVSTYGIQTVLDLLAVIAFQQEAAALDSSAPEQWGHIRPALQKVPQHKPPYTRR